jgi:hypothetical protein
MRGERADTHGVPCDFDVPEPRQTGDIDEYLRRRKAQVQRGKQALTTRENARPIAVALQQIEDFFAAARLRVGERRSFQAGSFRDDQAALDFKAKQPVDATATRRFDFPTHAARGQLQSRGGEGAVPEGDGDARRFVVDST